MHLLLERMYGILAVGLGGVHRDVGIAQQFIGSDWSVVQRDPNRRGHIQLPSVDRERGAQPFDNALGDHVRLCLAIDSIKEHGEFVATESRCGVARSQQWVDASRDPL